MMEAHKPDRWASPQSPLAPPSAPPPPNLTLLSLYPPNVSPFLSPSKLALFSLLFFFLKTPSLFKTLPFLSILEDTEMSASGSVSTVSREDNLVLSSEDSSSPDESELELGLGLSLGGAAAGFKQQATSGVGGGGQYARILTAKDFPSLVSSSPSSSLSSSSSSLSKTNHVTAGTKRTADSVAAANATSQVVGWPPIRASRINCIVNQAKSLANEEYNSMIEKNKRKNSVLEKVTNSSNNGGNAKGRTSLFVKVNMDGIPIGRKVDLSAHGCYETLAQTLEDMFQRPTTTVNAIRSSLHERDKRVEAKRPSKLLDGTSDFVLTYEDKEGDWMLVGDVPWGMFLLSVKRLRIMRTSEANGLAPRSQETSGRQRNKPI